LWAGVSADRTLVGYGRFARVIAAAALAAGLGASVSSLAQNRIGGGELQAGPLAKVIQPYIDSREIAGAVVLVANRDRVIDLETIGYADLTEHKPMEPNDMFWIASMSKAMTASAVMMLVDEGKISLDDPVEKYLPVFMGQMVLAAADATRGSAQASTESDSARKENASAKLETTKHPITIREILSHTSGLPFSSKREVGALDVLPLKMAVMSYAAEPLQSQPGTQYSYSNEGINTAARIVEVVSGMPFEDFMQQRLFSPLGMKDTTFWPTDEQVKRLAKSYEGGSLREVRIDQLTYPLSDRAHRFAIPAGGLFSTADDVARFCQMMLNKGTFQGKRYLTESSVGLITTKETGDAVAKPYGFGWNVGDGYFEHSGAYKTDMKVDVKRGLIVVFLVQHANDWALEDRQRLMDLLEGAEIAAMSTEQTAR